MERREPPRARHTRHGRHRSLLRGRARHAAVRHADGRADAPLLLRDRRRPDRCVLRDSRYADVRKAAGGPHRPRAPVRPPVVRLSSEDELHALQERLHAAGCEVTRVVDHGIMHSIYFTDPNGIALEASWWVHGATGRDDYTDPELYSDPNPVPALAELAAGRLEAVPATHLV